MSFDFENAYQLTTSDGEVKEISQNGTTVWERAVSTPAPQNTNFAPTRSGNALGVAITGNSQQGLLPAGYTQLDYVESSGTQYINTGLVVNFTNLTVEYKYRKTGSLSTNVLGFDAGNLYPPRLMHGGIYANSAYYGESSVVTNIPQVLGTDYTVKFEISRSVGYGKWTVNGSAYSVTSKGLNGWTDANTATQTKPDYLFASNKGDGEAQYLMSGRIYYVRYYKNNTELIANFIPAKNSSNVVGMYDLVSGQFFTNAGTGSFTAGTEVKPTPTNPIEVKGVGRGILPSGYTQLQYIQSSGTQWIDTGISPAGKKIGAVIDFQFTSTSRTTGGVFGSNKTDGTDNIQVTVNNSKWRIKINSYAAYGVNYNTSRHTARCNMSDGTSLDSTVYTTTQYTVASSNTCNVYVGACNYKDSAASTETYTLIGKLYSAKVYDDTTLVFDGIPAKNSSNVLGMYDLVSNTFFTNAGSDDFTAGPEATDWCLPITVGSTTYNPSIATPLQKVGTYADSISGSVLARNIKCVTLSAGTHTLSDAVSDAPYLCTQQETGTLTGTTLTLGADVSNAKVYYPLATPTTESFTQPTIPLTKATTYQWDLDTEISPTTSSLNYLGKEGA